VQVASAMLSTSKKCSKSDSYLQIWLVTYKKCSLPPESVNNLQTLLGIPPDSTSYLQKCELPTTSVNYLHLHVSVSEKSIPIYKSIHVHRMCTNHGVIWVAN